MWRYTLPLGSLGFILNAIFRIFPLPIPTVWGQTIADLIIAVILLLLYFYRSRNKRLFISRTLTFTILIGFILSIFGLTVLISTRTLVPLLSGSHSSVVIANFVAALIIGFSFEPLRRFLTSRIEYWLFKDEQNNQEYINALTEKLHLANRLDDALDSVVHTIVEALNLQFAITYVFQTGEDNHLAIKRVKHLGLRDTHKLAFAEHDSLFAYIQSHTTAFTTAKLERETKQEKQQIESNKAPLDPAARSNFLREHAIKVALVKRFKHLNISIIMPLAIDNQLLGLILLSPKKNHQLLSSNETALLETISYLTITSIQKAGLYEGEQLKGEFVSIASHELRTPLTAIKGYLSMMLDENIAGSELDKECHEYLAKVQHTTKQLQALINDMLAISRLESGKMTIEPQQLDPIPVILKIIEQARAHAQTQGIIIFTPNLEEDKLPPIWVDPEVFSQTIANLITNAITYNREGGQVELTAQFVEKPRAVVEFKISDTGIGMSKEQMGHLFERFYRVQTEETEGKIGTGLGLFLVKSLIERSNGTIKVESVRNKGTSFTVTFPTFKVEHSSSKPISSNVAAPKENLEPIGLILLPPKLNGDGFSAQDVNFLDALGREAITAIQKAKLYENDRSKSEFVSIATHELLTPISAIEGYLSMIVNHPEKLKKAKPQTIEYLNNIYNSAKRLSTLIRDVLSVARIESGKISINPVGFDLTKITNECIEQLTFLAQEKQITLKLKSPSKVMPKAFADPDRTAQIIINLISNAIKYNRPSGHVTVELNYEPANHIVTAEVSDDGLGMEKSEMEHLFEKFYRIDSPERTGIIGTGLGLYITKSILERMGGAIVVKSLPGKGSQFKFSLPAE